MFVNQDNDIKTNRREETRKNNIEFIKATLNKQNKTWKYSNRKKAQEREISYYHSAGEKTELCKWQGTNH